MFLTNNLIIGQIALVKFSTEFINILDFMCINFTKVHNNLNFTYGLNFFRVLFLWDLLLDLNLLYLNFIFPKNVLLVSIKSKYYLLLNLK